MVNVLSNYSNYHLRCYTLRRLKIKSVLAVRFYKRLHDKFTGRQLPY